MFNIITPTYNRSHTLNRVYESLKNQTFKDFIWFIIDDCSTDDTKDLVDEWKTANEFLIVYEKLNENKGKSSAVNYGLELCKYPYTIVADSDDSFVPETLSELKGIWEGIPKQEQDKIASIWTLTMDVKGNIIGDKFPMDYWQVGFKDRVLHHNIKGEKWACWKTSVLVKQKMYTAKTCHVQESHTWNAINKKYDFLCVNKSHRFYYYSDDGLIASKKSRKQTAAIYYLGSYFGLKDVSLKEMISHGYYRNLAFNYWKSSLFFNDKKHKLSTSKALLSGFISIVVLPKRLLKRGI